MHHTRSSYGENSTTLSFPCDLQVASDINFNKDFQEKLVKYFSYDHFVTSEYPAHNFLHFLHYLGSIGLVIPVGIFMLKALLK